MVEVPAPGVGVAPGLRTVPVLGLVFVPVRGAVEGEVVPLPGIVELFGVVLEPGDVGDVPPGFAIVWFETL